MVSMRMVGVVGCIAIACGPAVGSDGGDELDATSTAETRGSTSASDVESVGVDETTGRPTTTAASTGSVDSDDGGGSFIMQPDGGPGDGCEQPQPVEQPPSCGNGVREPDEFCYQGVASIYAMAEGTRLADFGAGPQVVFTDIESSGGIHLHPASAEGLLSAPTLVGPDTAYDLEVHDVDDDGALDLIVADAYGEAGSIAVWLGFGDGTFEPWTSSPIPAMHHLRLAMLDGDAFPDLVGTTDRYYGVGDVHLARGLGGGEWADLGGPELGDDVAPEIGDLDGDGLDDLVVLAWRAEDDVREILVVPMTPTGPDASWVLEDTGDFGALVLGELDDDDMLDVAYARDGDLVMAFGVGDGTLAEPVVIEPALDWPVAAADLDGDGRSEIVGTSSVRASTTGETWVFDVGCGHYGTKLASTLDVNGDGLRDIVLSTGYGQDTGAVHLVLSNP